jgi:hypothetical protein
MNSKVKLKSRQITEIPQQMKEKVDVKVSFLSFGSISAAKFVK